ncbi:HK97 family phage prohead protease [Corynebacterium pyruviciproducens]|uniref:HK97 family phage prohead protease n=1 Tax=Corynebacterium pyruviciproducens TaxID=598660 RepID=UPI00288A005F|nr:HK97 family phage prohead protease [Corynebacterium pyruviciproducens]
MIHLVVGPPCSGKSTFVATHAADGVPRFDYDAVACTLGGGDFNHDPPPPVNEFTLAARRGFLGYLFDPETTITEAWVINAYPSPATIDRFAAAGAEFHVLDPGAAECIARAERDRRPPSTVERIRRWYENPPTIPKGKSAMAVEKSFPATLKAADTPDPDTGTAPDPDPGDATPPGTITAYASVFGNVDSYGDVILPGAFTRTLKEWEASGRQIPLLYGHDTTDPFKAIGGVTSATEDDIGLKITATLDLDNPVAAQVYRLVKAQRLAEMSFAFNYVTTAVGARAGQEVTEVLDVDLFEVSIVPIGANRQSRILTVKSTKPTTRPDAPAPGVTTSATPADPARARRVRALLSLNERSI